MTEDNNFSQPTLETGTAPEHLPVNTAPEKSADLSGNDALSDALRKSLNPGPAVLARQEPERPRAKFALHYVLNGEEITETHMDEAHAVASFRRLRGLGITAQPETL
jgi:type IV secretory pathway ATPase VirB11/archaellum biosynthesis ATPase